MSQGGVTAPENKGGAKGGKKSESRDDEASERKQREIYTYEAETDIYAVAWSRRNDPEFAFRLAVGSFIEEYANKVTIIKLDDEYEKFVELGVLDHPYPPTKIMFVPGADCSNKDLFATAGDYLRVWQYTDTGMKLETVFNNSKRNDYCAPLTAFDWNVNDQNLLVTSSIDTTCSLWDIESQKAIVQLIAHDKEVFDVAFATRGRDVFGSVGADGSVRIFDKRKLDHSTIVYEAPNAEPLLRLEWNKQDPNFLATMAMDSRTALILDIRMPSTPIATLNGHRFAVNGASWAPHSSCHLCTASEDSSALIWDLSALPSPVEDPILAYTAPSSINMLEWSSLHVDWIAISLARNVQLLRV